MFNYESSNFMAPSSKLPFEYRAELEKSISAAKVRGVDVSLVADNLALKDGTGQVIFEDEPDDSHAYDPSSARIDLERFVSFGFRSFTFSELSGGAGMGDGDFSEFTWNDQPGFDVVANGFYQEDHGFNITLETTCPSLAGGPRIRLLHTRVLQTWPSSIDLAECQGDIKNLIKDWNLLQKYQAYLLDEKIEFNVGRSHISAQDFQVRAKEGMYRFRSISCQGDWDQATIESYERVTQRFSNWLKPKLTTSEELPPLETDLDLV